MSEYDSSPFEDQDARSTWASYLDDLLTCVRQPQGSPAHKEASTFIQHLAAIADHYRDAHLETGLPADHCFAMLPNEPVRLREFAKVVDYAH